jgi:hypothetical protein
VTIRRGLNAGLEELGGNRGINFATSAIQRGEGRLTSKAKPRNGVERFEIKAGERSTLDSTPVRG